MTVRELQIRFPELTARTSRCRLCQLTDDAPDLLAIAHELIRQGLTSTEIAKRMHAVLKEQDIRPVTARTVLNHVEMHISESRILNRYSKDAGGGDVPRVAKGGLQVVDGGVLPFPAKQSDVEADYHEMRRLYDKLHPILDMAFELLENASSEDGVDASSLITLVKVFSEARAQLETLSKMRNSDRLIMAILEWNTRALTHNVSEPLCRKLREILCDLDDDDAELAHAKLNTFLQKEIGPIFLAGARDALTKSAEEFKLPGGGQR